MTSYPKKTAKWTVWVGGTEVTDNYVDRDTADSILTDYLHQGYDEKDVWIEEVKNDWPNISNSNINIRSYISIGYVITDYLFMLSLFIQIGDIMSNFFRVEKQKNGSYLVSYYSTGGKLIQGIYRNCLSYQAVKKFKKDKKHLLNWFIIKVL